MLKRLIIRLIILVILTLGLVEGLLRLFDPWGVLHYSYDITLFFQNVEPAPGRNFISLPGIYQYSNWKATVLPDGSRFVPDTNPSAQCRIALLGDSVTFGHGVSDNVTWANLLARDFPTVHIINAGVDTYNIEDVWGTLRTVPANGYLYLLIDNDADPEFPFQNWNSGVNLPAILQYYRWIQIWRDVQHYPQVQVYAELDNFYVTLDKLAARTDTLIVGFPFPLTDMAKKRDPNIVTIQRWTHNVSVIDQHPNVEGSREIAEEVKPIFETLVRKVCR